MDKPRCYAAEYIIINGKLNPEKWKDRYFIEETEYIRMQNAHDDQGRYAVEMFNELKRVQDRNVIYEQALQQLAVLGNAPNPGNSEGNTIAQRALALAQKVAPMPIEKEYAEFVSCIAKTGEDIVDEMTPEKAHVWHMATGVCTEAGELLDAAKKHVCYNKPIDLENVIEELGDLEFYMEGLRAHLGITRDQVIKANIAKLSKRYPKGTFSNTDAQARADKS